MKKRNLFKEIKTNYVIKRLNADGVLVSDPVASVENLQAHKSEIVDLVQGATAEEKQQLIISLFCFNHSDKMQGMISLSTCCKTNKFCKYRANIKGSICAKCYAMQQLNRYGDQFIKNAIAGIVLTNILFNKADIPFINAAFIRLEAFGDIENETQLLNYATLCKVNSHARVALWSKNSGIVCKVFRELTKKPANLNNIYSPLYMDTPENEKFDAMRDIFDKQFTVYTSAATAAAQGVKINCGGNHCAGCLKCYKKNNIVQIAEILKSNNR